MPEVGISETPFTKSLRIEAEGKAIYEVPRDKILEIANQNDEEFIGKGMESIVVQYKGKPKHVIALNYYGMTPERAKSDFYFQRVMSTLFPHNFPHFYASFAGDKLSNNQIIGGTIRERVEKPRTSLKRKFREKLGISNVKYPFSNVIKAFDDLSINWGMFVEEVPVNEMLGADGGEYYVDNLEGLALEFGKWDIQRIIGYMKEKNYDSNDISIVTTSCKRLSDILKKSGSTT